LVDRDAVFQQVGAGASDGPGSPSSAIVLTVKRRWRSRIGTIRMLRMGAFSLVAAPQRCARDAVNNIQIRNT
jgi:hypothetical protein